MKVGSEKEWFTGKDYLHVEQFKLTLFITQPEFELDFVGWGALPDMLKKGHAQHQIQEVQWKEQYASGSFAYKTYVGENTPLDNFHLPVVLTS